ncbi:MAG: L,D-transpeptidase [Clostridia bacterium]|nr:L,D-transpeptidase [Clostridia bacterium]
MTKKLMIPVITIVAAIIGLGFIYSISSSKIPDAYNYYKDKLLYQDTGSNTSKKNKSLQTLENYHLRDVKPDIPLDKIIKDKRLKANGNYNIFVDMKTRTLSLKHGETVLKQYRIAGGSNTHKGNKEKEGDRRTPLGEFYICSKEVYSPSRVYIGSRWMLLSYPNIEAADRGLKNKLINKETYKKISRAIKNKKIPPQDTSLGNAVGIHGGAVSNYAKDWTAGCIGMYDQDVEEIYKYIKVGTKVMIK